MDTVTEWVERARSGAREDAFHGLRELGDDALLAMQSAFRREGDPVIRALLVEAAWQVRHASAIAFLAEALRDPAPAVWKQALDGLVTLASPESIRALDLARDREADPGRRGWIDEASGQAVRASGHRATARGAAAIEAGGPSAAGRIDAAPGEGPAMRTRSPRFARRRLVLGAAICLAALALIAPRWRPPAVPAPAEAEAEAIRAALACYSATDGRDPIEGRAVRAIRLEGTSWIVQIIERPHPPAEYRTIRTFRIFPGSRCEDLGLEAGGPL